MSGRTCLVLLALILSSSYAEDRSTGRLQLGASKEDALEVPAGLTEMPEMPEMPDASKLPDTPGPYSEVPSDADAEKPKPAMQDWRSRVLNASQGSLGSLVSLQTWQDHQFCNVHETGFFCVGLTRIRCCKLEDGGYAKCGSTANSRDCAAHQEPKSPKEKALFRPPKPYWPWSSSWHPPKVIEAPSAADADHPKPAIHDWTSKVPNATQQAFQGTYGSYFRDQWFCRVHNQTGYFCDGLTRIRCCKWGRDSYSGYAYKKCGSTANSSTCAAQREPKSTMQKGLFRPPMGYPSYPTFPNSGGSSWVIHRGWHVSSFCQSHHVGSFCRSHHIIHCCNDYGHFVECNSAYSDSGRWC
eukprot:Skav202153  [mRNA]  locus=scaffold970:187841:188905:- [translate_table: standard]